MYSGNHCHNFLTVTLMQSVYICPHIVTHVLSELAIRNHAQINLATTQQKTSHTDLAQSGPNFS